MSDFNVSEETQAVFDKHHLDSGNENYYSFKMAHSPKIKPSPSGITKIIIQNKEIKRVESTTKSNLADFLIVINDDIFIRLSEQEQEIVVEKVFCGVEFENEKDAILKAQPSYQEFQGMREKHGDNLLEAVNLSLRSHHEKIVEAQAEAKAAMKPKKRKRGE